MAMRCGSSSSWCVSEWRDEESNEKCNEESNEKCNEKCNEESKEALSTLTSLPTYLTN